MIEGFVLSLLGILVMIIMRINDDRELTFSSIKGYGISVILIVIGLIMIIDNI